MVFSPPPPSPPRTVPHTRNTHAGVHPGFVVPRAHSRAPHVRVRNLGKSVEADLMSFLVSLLLCGNIAAGSMEELGCIPEQFIGRVSVSVLHGLSYLEGLKIMHRDIKPSNILMNTSGDIKLCDFGVSTQLAHSMTATYVGTNAYMAPERVRGTPYTIRSEIWSLGLSLVELALGRFPYPADSTTTARAITPIELLQCIVHEPPPRLPEADFSPQFVDFTAR